MKASVPFIIGIFFISACQSTNTKIKEEVAGADSVAINFYKGDGTMDTVAAVRIIRDKKQIEQLTNYISATAANTEAKCGFDGSIHYFKLDKVTRNIDFRMNEANCMLFTFTQDGITATTKLSPEAKQFLEGLKK